MKVFAPLHVTPDWIGREVSRRHHDGKAGPSARRTTYIHPKNISIREYIARAETLKGNHESI